MKKYTLLFDFDGVVCDTEKQYTFFWDRIGEKYFNKKNFGRQIKGQNLLHIKEHYFSNFKLEFNTIVEDLNTFEANMKYEYVPGFCDFIKDLKCRFNTAIVTSSNKKKMSIAFREHPELNDLFDKIFTSENTVKSKPDPECYLVGMDFFKSKPKDTFIFEDSFAGLESAKRSGARVIGLSTTNSVDEISKIADLVISNFENFDIQRVMEM